jgi:hypothetical protein
MRLRVSGIDLITTQGGKGPGDVRLDAILDGRRVPVSMELAFCLVDFFAENEDYLESLRPWWRFSGSGYFMRRIAMAPKLGWRVLADEVSAQRLARRAS